MDFYKRRTEQEVATVAKESDRSNARLDPAGLHKWQPGVLMIALWVLGMALFVSVAVALRVVTLVLPTL